MNLFKVIEYFERYYHITMNENTKELIVKRNLHLDYSDYQIEKLKKYLCFVGSNDSKILQEKIIEIVEALRRNNNGKIYENLFYAWLFDKGISFKEQVNVPKENCLKAKDGYSSDGCIAEHIYFDVKSFGMSEKLVTVLKQKLQEYYPKDLITISGNKDVDSAVYEKMLREVDDIIKSLDEPTNAKQDIVEHESENAKIIIHRYIGLLDENNPIITKRRSIAEISEMDSTKWAKNNETYPLKHGAQFIKNNPFILVYPFKKYEFTMPLSDDREAYYAFRFIARRVFLNLIKNKNELLSDYDKNADENISIGDAVSYLSGILFWNIDEEWDYTHNRMWLYCNPNAVNRIPNYMINSIFRNMGCYIDTFKYDNY